MAVNINQVGCKRRLAVVERLLRSRGFQVDDDMSLIERQRLCH